MEFNLNVFLGTIAINAILCLIQLTCNTLDGKLGHIQHENTIIPGTTKSFSIGETFTPKPGETL